MKLETVYARVITVETSENYVYDPERVSALHAQLQPPPDLYSEDEVYAVFAYLYGSPFHSDVFEDSGGSGGMWPVRDVEYDPDA